MLSDVVSNVIVWLCATILLGIGVGIAVKLFQMLKQVTDEVENADENQIMLNSEQLNVRRQVTKGLTSVRAVVRTYRSHALCYTAPLAFVLLLCTFLVTLTWGPKWGEKKVSGFDAFLFALAYLLGVGVAIGCNMVLTRLASVAGALGVIGAHDGHRQSDTAAAYSATVRRVSLLGLSSGMMSIAMMMIGGTIVIHIAIAQYTFSQSDVLNMGRLMASFSLGHCTVYASQSVQGTFLAKSIGLVFDRFEVDMYNHVPNPLQLLNSIVGDGLALPLNLFQSVSDVVVCWILTTATYPALRTNLQTMLFLPFILLGLSSLSFCVVWGISQRATIVSGQALIRRTRLMLVLTVLVNLALYGIFFVIAYPPGGHVGINSVVTHAEWGAAWGVTILGGLVIIVLVEVAEIATSPQFVFLRTIAKNVDVGSSPAYLAAKGTSQLVFYISATILGGALYAAWTIAGHQGFPLLALGSLAPLCCAATISTFSLLAVNAKHMGTMAMLPREVVDVLEQLAFKCDVCLAMAYSYSSLAGGVVSLSLCAGLVSACTLNASGGTSIDAAALVLFNPKSILFVLSGMAFVKLLSGLTLVGVSHTVRKTHKSIKRVVESASAQSASGAVFNVSGELDPPDQLVECTQDILTASRGFFFIIFGAILLIVPAIGFGFGAWATVPFAMGLAFASFESTLGASILGATTEGIRHYVVQGGLIGDSAFGFHHLESLVTSSIGSPQRLASGSTLLLLVKMLLLALIIGSAGFGHSPTNNTWG